jgi:glycosyltransferase involved in cell wall biosynthesis
VANCLLNARKNGVNAVYAYEDGALQSFTKAKELGIKCIYDLPIAYWAFGRQLMLEEAERLPDWAVTLAGGVKDSSAKLDRKVQELTLANTVIVPSKFVQDSLPSGICANKRIVLSPFGSPTLNRKDINLIAKKDFQKPLRVLFAGSMGQRKGLGDLFAAIQLLNTRNIELVVMGSLIEPLSFYKKALPNFTYEHGRAHDEVLALMGSCDVFCLPSIVEGRALVMQEAMSQGLPLIITPNTGGEDLIIEGKTGFLVPIRRPDIIAEKLDWFLHNRHLIPSMAENAKIHAAKYTWDNYTNTIINSLLL